VVRKLPLTIQDNGDCVTADPTGYVRWVRRITEGCKTGEKVLQQEWLVEVRTSKGVFHARYHEWRDVPLEDEA
jgi:hypothetical protein